MWRFFPLHFHVVRFHTKDKNYSLVQNKLETETTNSLCQVEFSEEDIRKNIYSYNWNPQDEEKGHTPGKKE